VLSHADKATTIDPVSKNKMSFPKANTAAQSAAVSAALCAIFESKESLECSICIKTLLSNYYSLM